MQQVADRNMDSEFDTRERMGSEPMVTMEKKMVGSPLRNRPTQNELNQMAEAEKDALLMELFDHIEASERALDEKWPYDVFFSYHRDDWRTSNRGDRFLDLVNRRANAICGRNLRIFVDKTGLKAGEEWGPSLKQAIEDSRVFVAILSEPYLRSPFCQNELEHFWKVKSEEPDSQRVLIPIFWNRTIETLKASEIYNKLKEIHWLFSETDARGIELRKHLPHKDYPDKGVQKELEAEIDNLVFAIYSGFAKR